MKNENKNSDKKEQNLGIGGIMAIMSGIILFNLALAYITTSSQESGQKLQKKIINDSPIKIQYKHLNSDGIEDRVISNSASLYQEQFGYKNPNGEIEYLTIGQIQERVKSELENKTEKYRTQKEKVLK
ncbi:MAG: hypothetical protein ABIB79_04825 [archaeon]